MEFHILGPLEVSAVGGPVPLGGPKQRLVLAHLLLRRNDVVPADTLIDEVWGPEPPPAARPSLQSYVSHLRTALGGEERIEGVRPGYVLHLSPDELDADRFAELVREGGRSLATEPAAAVERFEAALGLWRGPAFADLADEPSLLVEISRLEEARVTATEDLIAARLALGRHDDVVGEATALVSSHPLRERPWGQIMLALYRAGRQAEALDAYQRVRSILADELGVDPSPSLQELQRRILGHDVALDLLGAPLRGYRLLERIGEGSFGVVYRASQPHVERDVAVKVIHPHLAAQPGFVRRFGAEAQLVARLEHPHIVPLYDYWREPDGAYLVMRWLRGGSLQELTARGPLELEPIGRMLDQVAAALTAAHRAGVVHRDVKPANVLLDEDANAYLSDFGIAAAGSGGAPGSPSPEPSFYSSPEQLRGEEVTERTDIFSLGLILFEALAGRHPFAAEVRGGREARSDPVPSVRAHRPDLPPSVDDVIARATAIDPADRFEDAATFAAAFHEAMGAPATRAVAATLANPYRGLEPFREADAADFFGRETLTERLVARLARGGPRFLAVVGPSGSGKSSAVRAGLIPAIRRGAVPGSERWFVTDMHPGRDPVRELADALVRVAVEPPVELWDALEGGGGAVEAVGRILPPGSDLVVLVDQFEELFTLAPDDERRRRFIGLLVAAATDPGSRVHVIVTLRADLYDRPLADRALGELLRSGTEQVLPLSPQELERAIVGPTERVGVAPEPGLVSAIVAEVVDQPGSLPLLQFTLRELFERRAGASLTVEAYEDLGGVAGALVRRAEEIYGGLDLEAREAAHQLFLRLVAIGDRGEHTRRRVLQDEAVRSLGRDASMRSVIDAFGRHRLLAFDRDPLTRGPTVEVAHEALLSAWDRLRGWIDDARDDLRTHARLVAAAAEWVAAEEDPSFLLRGERLDRFRSWAASTDLATSDAEHRFLAASQAARDAERAREEARRAREASLQRRSLRRLRALVAVITAGALVAGALAVFAIGQRRVAREEAGRAGRAARAATARELAGAARATIGVDPDLAILLAIRSAETTRGPDGIVLREAEEALHDAVGASRAILRLPGRGGVAVSPDGDLIATDAPDGVTLYDADDGREVRRLPIVGPAALSFSQRGGLLAAGTPGGVSVSSSDSGQPVMAVETDTSIEGIALSPDGTMVAGLEVGGDAVVWRVPSGREVLRVPFDAAVGLAFDPTGGRLAVPLGSGTTIYDLRTGDEVVRLAGDGRHVAFSADTSVIATAGLSGRASVWDADSGRRRHLLVGHEGHVNAVAVSADGSLVATGADDGLVKVWDAVSGRELMTIPGLLANVESLAFTGGDARLIGASASAALVWDVTSRGELLAIPTAGIAFNVAYSSDGVRIITAEEGGLAVVRDATTGGSLLELVGHEGPVSDVVPGPDGRTFATSGFDGTARLWDADGSAVRTLLGHTRPVWAVAFSPDGSMLVTVSEDRTARVWDVATGAILTRFDRHFDNVYDAAFSPDGSMIASVSNDFTARIWDPTTGEELHVLPHAENLVEQAWSPDARYLATAGFDGTARVWDARTGDEAFVLGGHGGVVADVESSPDGSTWATASNDVRIWDAATGAERLRLAVPAGALRLAFSPDGRHLATALDDGTLRVYTLDVEELLDLARERATRGLTDAECRQYVRGPCPA